MRRDTAVRRLRTIAELCGQVHRADPVLQAGYVFGELLDGPAEVEAVQVTFVLDLPPPEQLPWYTEPPACGRLAYLLELGKAPVRWYWRPAAWPVANHLIRQPIVFWSAQTGVAEPALRALAEGHAQPLRPAPPPAAELAAQLQVELAASLAHLRQVHGRYWQRDWRAAHRGGGSYPEQHLYDAVDGYLDLLNATNHYLPEPADPT